MRTRFRIAAAVVATAALGAVMSLHASATTTTTTTTTPSTAAALQAPARAAAAVGKLTPTGCTFGAGTAACDLYAMTGTTTLLGIPVPIWGFSGSGAAGTATAPGPVLVVHQGDHITVTLHNELNENVSLAFPGQPMPTGGEDTAGIATGSSRTYTFTASRAGTFLYEAGHTSGGARQVAMGLAGAFVVLPADGTAYGSQPAGFPATAYDDDAVVVLSEVDPAFNASPTTFDLRKFAPKYRLINGKPYPATDPVATDQGHKVLLRYVNVGSQTHPMGVLGGEQVEIAQGGHPQHYATTVAAESVEPGQTLDSLVTMPTGPEAKLALYETARHLDNNGQQTDDPLQVSFGGMLTFLDTNAPPPSKDSVGPVSTHVHLSPNPSDGLAPVTVTADLSDAATGGSTVSQAEFVIDDAVVTGVGFGTPMTLPGSGVSISGATGTITTAVLDALAAGRHTVFVRALDAAGNWGVVGSAILNLPKTGPQTTNGAIADVPANGSVAVSVSATGDDSEAGGVITAAEYFVDAVGTSGSGTQMTLNRTATVVSEDVDLPAAFVTGLGEGMHHVFVHSKDSLGLWGPPLDIPLPVDLTGPAVDAASVGPNPTNGVLSDKSNPGNLLVSAQITDKDAGGAMQSTLTDAEAFLDPTVPNPAGGTGLQMLPVDGKLDSTSEAFYGLIPLTQAKALSDGLHHVYVRGQDAAGNWGPLFAVNLVVDKTAPVLGTLTATPNPVPTTATTVTMTATVTDASLIAKAEYWIGATDPGVGLGTSLPVSVVGNQVQVTVPLSSVPGGSQLFNLRVQDLAGNWSKPVNTTVVVNKANEIFSDSFESGGFGLWSATTGGVSITTGAKVPTSIESGTTRGLQVSLPGAGYLTDNTPAGEKSYHARFAFNRNTLTSGTNTATALSLLQGRSATGQVFSLDYRLNGATPQVRTVMSRSGTTALTGTWISLTSGAHRLQVDWVSGPATGTSAGSLKLSVDGAVKSTLTGNTSTLQIETAWLGVSAGMSSTSSGTAFFDSFASTRFTMP